MDRLFENLPLEDVKDIRVASGGDVNQAFKIYTNDDEYFMLVQENTDEDFYKGEIAGLKLFEKIEIVAPRVIANGYEDNKAYLILSFLEEGTSGSQSDLARTVAKVHQYKSPNGKFGFDNEHRGSDTTYTNEWTDSWKEVIIDQRLDVLKDQLVEMNLWNELDVEKYEKVRNIINRTLDNHKSEASLLHGDLWGGNYMFLKDGTPALFDPSPFYGDREFDIGITTVFGGFTDEFYKEYNNIYPLSYGYEKRIEFYRLFLFMVHMVKFGRTYESSVSRAMDNILNF